jgi:hypothetical protein
VLEWWDVSLDGKNTTAPSKRPHVILAKEKFSHMATFMKQKIEEPQRKILVDTKTDFFFTSSAFVKKHNYGHSFTI